MSSSLLFLGSNASAARRSVPGLAVLLSLSALPGCAADSNPNKSTGRLPVDGQEGDGDGDTESDQDVDEDGKPGVNSGPDACADVETTPVRTVPTVVFLVDGSSSMKCVYPEDTSTTCDAQLDDPKPRPGEKTRWQALSEALKGTSGAPGLIESLGSVIRFGLWIYNDNPVKPECPGFASRVDPNLDQTSAITSAFPAEPPGYNTPTGLALSALVASLPTPDQRDQMKLGPQRIVLATDGEPFACMNRETLAAPAMDYASVLSATAEADAKDIDVYVMSLAPASGDFASHLDQVAQAGHTGQAYAPANKDQLSAALNAIIEEAISCTVEIEGEIDDPAVCKGKARLGDSMLRCGDPNGFTIVDAQHVRLEGTACERFKREPGIELSMTFPCFQLQ
jgi:hypothetical protein